MVDNTTNVENHGDGEMGVQHNIAIGLIPLYLNKGNCRHLTLSFPCGSSFAEMKAMVQAFVTKTCQLSGLPRCRIAHTGYLFTKPSPHGHLLLIGDRDSRTGKGVGHLHRQVIDDLFRWWRQSTDGKGSAQWRGVYDQKRLDEYLRCERNLAHEGQECVVIPLTNLSVIERIRTRQEKRYATDPVAPSTMGDCCPTGCVPSHRRSLSPRRSPAGNQTTGITRGTSH